MKHLLLNIIVFQGRQQPGNHGVSTLNKLSPYSILNKDGETNKEIHSP